MPDSRLVRTRATLPEGYQYGDARFPVIRPDGIDFGRVGTHDWLCALPWGRCTCGADPDGAIKPIDSEYLRKAVSFDQRHQSDPGWRAPHENAAAQLKRRATAFDDMTAHSAAEMLDLLESQRTGDEAV